MQISVDCGIGLAVTFAIPPYTQDVKEVLRQFEKHHIQQVLEQVSEDQKKAANLLEMSLSSLYWKIEELGIL